MKSLACSSGAHNECSIVITVNEQFVGHCACNCHGEVINKMVELGRLTLELPISEKEIPTQNHTSLEFSIVELKTLYRIFEHQYISYEDLEAHAVLRKISQTIAEYDKAMTDESTNKLAR